MKIIPFIYNDPEEIIANSYIVIDDKNNCLVVDPSKDYDGLVNYILKNNLKLKGILLTHTHFDHIRGLNKLIEAFNCDIYVSPEDSVGLSDADYNCSNEFGTKIEYKNLLYKFISENEPLNLIEEPIKIIFTPFHTKGSVCYYLQNDKVLLSGDTLFKGTIGRTDLKSSDPKEQFSSLRKLLNLPDDVKVLPGHGPFTTIGEEKKTNKYFLYL